MSRYGWGGILAFMVCTSALGCFKSKQPWEIVYPTTGVVKLEGKPIAGARVTLIPQDQSYPSSVRPAATSKEDGSFTIGTYSTADGAPVGNYKALVLHFPVIISPDSATTGPNDLPEKYSRVETTDLAVTIKPAKTEFELELN